MLLFMDENVPDSVARFFRERGHDVRLVREELPTGTPDQIIATVVDELEGIVVTWNHKDFKSLAARMPKEGYLRFRKLGRINFRCNEAHGRRRAEENIEMIEFAYQQAQRRRDKRLLIEIGETYFRLIQ